MIIGGIDEAGYGPRLGPYCLTFISFYSDVYRSRIFEKSNFEVKDSKVIFKGRNKFEKLKRYAHLLLKFFDKLPSTVEEYLLFNNIIKEETRKSLKRLPWYEELSSTFVEDIEEVKVSSPTPCCLYTAVLPENLFNEYLEKYGNKMNIALSILGKMLGEFWQKYRDSGYIVIDHLSSKKYYFSFLQNIFDSPIHIIEERSSVSIYEIIFKNSKRLKIVFQTKADTSEEIVSAASIISKYLRELYMKCFNSYWRKFYPLLRPTSGYPLDTKRFLSEIAPKERAHIIIRKK